ncbi:MAG: 4-alpha-glucanotransferase [Spirochaetales bacterium]|nr:4-alpha-glucanotransferase [Candidatus Physcosoma equi]
MDTTVRRTGVLMHITSLPSQYGVGDLGDEAYRFVDSISENGISLWQILPTGPTGYGDSPYASRSAFAGNELFISPKKLFIAGYLDIEDAVKKAPTNERVDYGEARSLKMPMLFKAASTFLATAEKKDMAAFKAFRKEEGWWLEDYALFQSLCAKYNDSRWFSVWPKELRVREEKALKKAIKEQRTLIDIYCVLQYFFFSQWKELKTYANEKGVQIVGDIPIFVAGDSADAWTNTKLLQFDENCIQEACAGVPPDAFSSTGQLWGNPLYRWEEHEKTNFAWWIKRIEANYKLADVIRIDHFRGFEAYWRVPAGEDTAMNGKWVKGPGQKLFARIKEVFGDRLPMIAEDLGVITPEVEALRDDNNLPGMKILQFAFGLDEKGEFDTTNAYLLQNCTPCSVAYTGTHDNSTTVGWYKTLDEGTKDYVRRYFECADEEVLWRMIRHLMLCPSKWVIFPMQDILGLGEEARMNVPSTCGTSNWSWKMKEEDITSPSFGGIKYYSKLYGRVPETNEN